MIVDMNGSTCTKEPKIPRKGSVNLKGRRVVGSEDSLGRCTNIRVS